MAKDNYKIQLGAAGIVWAFDTFVVTGSLTSYTVSHKIVRNVYFLHKVLLFCSSH
jgi:hypothetical protein